MMIIKCHALSQLTFVNQFQNISGKDIKIIEQICYKFLWKGGPERVKRSTLKLDKLEGGIDGIDIESFLHAIKIRQFFKADLNCIPLGYIQKHHPNNDEISQASRMCLSKVLKYCWKDTEILDLNPEEQTTLANVDLRYFLKPGCKTDVLLQGLNSPTLNELVGYGRSTVNKVTRNVPVIFKHLLRFSLPGNKHYPLIKTNGKNLLIDKVQSKCLQRLIKDVLRKTVSYKISSKYINFTYNANNEKSSWFYLWKIRNPILRHSRLKIMYKDIYSQERRHRFGLAQSSECLICKEVESVEHQLFECKNARRLWQIYNMIFAENIRFEQIVYSQTILAKEIVKAVITKMLVQIDRSQHLSVTHAIAKVRQAVALEFIVTQDRHLKDILTLIDQILN